MALNLFGALGALGRLLPNYVEGQRAAIQDNWNDLNQYNQAQRGQLLNAFDESAFNPRLSMVYDAAGNSLMGVYNNAMQTNINREQYPSRMIDARIQSMFQPYLSTTTNQARINQANMLANMQGFPGSTGGVAGQTAGVGSLEQLLALLAGQGTAQNTAQRSTAVNLPSILSF